MDCKRTCCNKPKTRNRRRLNPGNGLPYCLFCGDQTELLKYGFHNEVQRWICRECNRGRKKKQYHGPQHEALREYGKQYQRDHAHHARAYSRLAYRVASGKIQKPELCPNCNGAGTIYAYRPDIENHPDHFIWFCGSCRSAAMKAKKVAA